MIECKNIVSINHPNGFGIERHTHTWHELVYCVDGKGAVCIDNKKCDFFTGNYYIIRRGLLHSENDFSDTRIIYFGFDAPDSFVREGVYTDYDGTVLSFVKKLQKEMMICNSYGKEMAECLVKAILIESRRNAECGRANDGMISLLQYIDENIEQDIDFRILAEKHHYSFDHFRHIFKEYTGMSPHKYVVSARIEKACFLLKITPKASLSEISFNCGFASSSHFSKAFRVHKGVTPSEYAKKHTRYQADGE